MSELTPCNDWMWNAVAKRPRPEFYATRAFLEDTRVVQRDWRTVTILGASRYRIIRKWYLPDTYVLVLI